MQLMQVYVQKSTSTTRPRSEASDSGVLGARRRVEPVLGVGEFGRGADVLQAGGDRQQARPAGVVRGGRRGGGARLELGFVAAELVQAAFDRVGFLEARGEVHVGDPFRDLLVEADVEVP